MSHYLITNNFKMLTKYQKPKEDNHCPKSAVFKLMS